MGKPGISGTVIPIATPINVTGLYFCIGDAGHALADVHQRSDVYERIIPEHPEQWVWFHRRWRRPKPDSVR
ncbi:MAG: hypothetical protein C4518_16740 [Desulfobacteraceae bacterium]|nr:MAG: hypothetical protein C4518_16740 [Desulfobacteraceae bacterium]